MKKANTVLLLLLLGVLVSLLCVLCSCSRGKQESSAAPSTTAVPTTSKEATLPSVPPKEMLFGTLREDKAALLRQVGEEATLSLLCDSGSKQFSGKMTSDGETLTIGDTSFPYRTFNGDMLLEHEDRLYLLEPLTKTSELYAGLLLLTETVSKEDLQLSFEGMTAHLKLEGKEFTVPIALQNGTILLKTGGENLALGAAAFASSSETEARLPSRANDGDAATRWSSVYEDDQWLMLDFGQAQKVSRVVLQWERAAGKDYRLQVSLDGKTWKTVADVTNNGVYEEPLTYVFDATEARYIRMEGSTRTTEYGFSVYEFAVFESADEDLVITYAATDTGYCFTILGKTYTIQR